ncbi:hypothetical protein [Mesorhizobium sp.]|uniref:hypothetical protein n=1 Tax=Mesorhizobium sp. TaxID=1871066 RepID=UPI00257AAF54|nr:hypothetical protein [Mesorhizobium sp.]
MRLEQDDRAALGVEAMPAGFDMEKGVDLVSADADAGAESWQIEIVEAPGEALERHVHGLGPFPRLMFAGASLMFADDRVKWPQTVGICRCRNTKERRAGR